MGYRTDNTLDINQFLNAYFDDIIDSFHNYVLTKDGGKITENDIARAMVDLEEKIDEMEHAPEHVLFVLNTLSDFSAQLASKLHKICHTTALAKSQEHWRDRLPLVFVLSSGLLLLKLIDDFKSYTMDDGSLRRLTFIDFVSV